jgi:L-rhamnose mutarotase
MAADAATQRWWALMEPMQEKWPTAAPAEWWSNMTEVFHLD